MEGQNQTEIQQQPQPPIQPNADLPVFNPLMVLALAAGWWLISSVFSSNREPRQREPRANAGLPESQAYEIDMPVVPTSEFIPVDVISSERVEEVAGDRAIEIPFPTGDRVMEIPLPTPTSSVQPFEWTTANIQKLAASKHLMIVAPTDGGKTTLADWMLRQLPGKVAVLTPKRKSYQWQGFKVIGAPRDFDAIAQYLKGLIDLLNTRSANLDEPHERLNIVLDEVPTLKRQVANWAQDVPTLLTESREANYRVLALCHGLQVRTWGMEGESDLLECMNTIRLGEFALKHCRRLVNRGDLSPEHLEWLTQQSRPAMVGDRVACVPEISVPESVVDEGEPTPQPEVTAPTKGDSARKEYPLEQKLAAIMRYVSKNGNRANVRKIQQAKLKELAGHSSDEIRVLFGEIKNLQMGRIKDDELVLLDVG